MKHARPDYDARVQDAANLIPRDEPVFLLRGQDLAAQGRGSGSDPWSTDSILLVVPDTRPTGELERDRANGERRFRASLGSGLGQPLRLDPVCFPFDVPAGVAFSVEISASSPEEARVLARKAFGTDSFDMEELL